MIETLRCDCGNDEFWETNIDILVCCSKCQNLIKIDGEPLEVFPPEDAKNIC